MTSVFEKQKAYFQTGDTLSLSFRQLQLERLYTAIVSHENDICEALHMDLGKGKAESYMCEIGMVLSEITHMRKHLSSYAKRHIVPTPVTQFPSVSYTQPVPLGCVLIMSPWNYPFLLTFDPLVCAIAAGNTAVLKPGPASVHTNRVMKQIIEELFDPDYITLIEGGIETADALLDEPFDLIFFTGSTATGRHVMEKAAKHLTPVVLELGGKSTCIVDESADIPLAAKRIVFGKYLNCGQTCVAPDYVLVHHSVHDRLIEEMKKQIVRQFSGQPLHNDQYGKIITQSHLHRLAGLVDHEKAVYGGQVSYDTCQMEPVIMDGVTWQDPIMQEEIFGPVMPVLTYDDFDEVVRDLQNRPSPLALYLFSHNAEHRETVDRKLKYGGGCMNDTIIHLATNHMGFGGVGESGMGSYHGKDGFNAFSHVKSIVDKKCWLDLPMRYAPYHNKIYQKLIRFFLK
ncbi:MAG: aldehyde dehydrogenase [Bulleidia sp.]